MTPRPWLAELQEIMAELAQVRKPWYCTDERHDRVQRTYEAAMFAWMVREARRVGGHECWNVVCEKLFAWEPNLEH
jgi:hypothetical protein